MLLQTTTGLAATISILDLNSQWSNGWTGTEGRASRGALGTCGRSTRAGGTYVQAWNRPAPQLATSEKGSIRNKDPLGAPL